MGELIQFPQKPLAEARLHVQAGAEAAGMLDLYDSHGLVGIDGCVPWSIFFSMDKAFGGGLGRTVIFGSETKVVFDAQIPANAIPDVLAPAKAAGVLIRV